MACLVSVLIHVVDCGCFGNILNLIENERKIQINLWYKNLQQKRIWNWERKKVSTKSIHPQRRLDGIAANMTIKHFMSLHWWLIWTLQFHEIRHTYRSMQSLCNQVNEYGEQIENFLDYRTQYVVRKIGTDTAWYRMWMGRNIWKQTICSVIFEYLQIYI